VSESVDAYERAIALGDDSPETKRLFAIALSQAAVERDKTGQAQEAER
jgi:hypothetical protein